MVCCDQQVLFLELKMIILVLKLKQIVSQHNWNMDKFDGHGHSKIKLTKHNLKKNMLLVMDNEWLGVGRVRCGFVIDGKTHYAHEFTHSDYNVQYTTTPRWRISYYINGTKLKTSLSTKLMCSSCILEGGFTPLGKRNSIRTPSTGIIMPIVGTKYVILALKINPLYPNSLLKLINYV